MTVANFSPSWKEPGAEHPGQVLLSKYHGEETELQRVAIRPVTVRGQACLSFVYTYKTRDITKNFPHAEALALIADMLPAAFKTPTCCRLPTTCN